MQGGAAPSEFTVQYGYRLLGRWTTVDVPPMQREQLGSPGTDDGDPALPRSCNLDVACWYRCTVREFIACRG